MTMLWLHRCVHDVDVFIAQTMNWYKGHLWFVGLMLRVYFCLVFRIGLYLSGTLRHGSICPYGCGGLLLSGAFTGTVGCCDSFIDMEFLHCPLKLHGVVFVVRLPER